MIVVAGCGASNIAQIGLLQNLAGAQTCLLWLVCGVGVMCCREGVWRRLKRRTEVKVP